MELTDLKEQLDTAWRELKGTLETQAGELKAFKETRSETATKIEALDAKIGDLQAELIEQVRKLEAPKQSEREVPKTAGQLFAESDAVKQMIDSKSNISAPVTVKRLSIPRGRKALSDITSFTALPWAGYADVNLDRLSLRDLLNVVPTTESAIEYVRVVGFAAVSTVLTTATANTDTSIAVASSAGFVPGQPIMVGTTPKIVATVPDATHITVTVAFTGVNAVGTRVTQKHIFPTPEKSLKPTGDWASLTVETATMRTLAASVDATRQVLSDQNQLESLIDNQLAFEMAFSEQYQILYGPGGSNNLNGILSDADIQTYNWSDGQVGDTKIDALRRALTLVLLARYPADGIAMNPTDWEDIELAKGSDGHYLWITVPSGPGAGANTFFRLPVAVTESVAAGTAVPGSWRLGATLYDREQANIRASDGYNDYFKKNMLAILEEERIALAVNRPEAFVEVTFDSAPA